MTGERSIKILLAAFLITAAAVLAAAYFHSSSIPDTVGRPLTEAEQAAAAAENSSMTGYVMLSPNADFPREGRIEKITIHHMGGDFSLEQVGESFALRDRNASANYGIDSSGRVGLYVEEKNRSWASSDKENDDQAVTIEVANDSKGGDWHVSDEAFDCLISLCADICRRNGIEKLVYTGDPEGNLTYHKMFSEDTECPGPYLESRMRDIETLVNKELEKNDGGK